jgi:NAD(P)H-nitrite reductase large subunit
MIVADEDRLPCYLCRCEQVTEENVASAVERGALSLNEVKRLTRAGMGLCQGVYCLTEVGRLLQGKVQVDPRELVPMTARPPVRQIELRELASLVPETDESFNRMGERIDSQ